MNSNILVVLCELRYSVLYSMLCTILGYVHEWKALNNGTQMVKIDARIRGLYCLTCCEVFEWSQKGLILAQLVVKAGKGETTELRELRYTAVLSSFITLPKFLASRYMYFRCSLQCKYIIISHMEHYVVVRPTPSVDILPLKAASNLCYVL